MITKRNALQMGMLFLLLFASACGGAAPVAEEPAAPAPAEPAAPAEEPAMPAGDAYFLEAEAPLSASESAPQNWGVPPAKRQPTDTFFEDYGVNPFIDAEDDNLSTFALDVDTGSYTIMRNYLKDGLTVPPASVRVEEYINYFDQNYPNPPAHQAFSISMDGAPSPFTQTERYQMLRIGVQGYQVPDQERKDASLTFVIDVSGSMDMDNRLGLVKRSLELLVEQLGRRDSVSIVVYGSDSRVILDPTSGADKDAILSAIYSLRPEGATNAEAGIRLGYRMAMHAYNPEGINRVILCSDGVANVGNTEANAILDEIHSHVEEGITMTTIGFGMDNYNDVLMEQLADNGDGFYAYVDDMREAKRLFIDNLTGTLQTIAMDAKIQVDFNPVVVARYRLVGFENRAIADDDFRDNSVDAGEIGAGHSVTALYEVKLYPEAYGDIATVFLRWQDPDTRQVVELSKDFRVTDLERDFNRADPYIQRTVIVAEFAEILKESYWAEGSSFGDVYREASRISDLFGRDEDMSELVELMRRAGRWYD
ncbi:MAG TPA: von Willebrand factor type A domain-containing protein [Anaerolineales bacterium]|nr:von Willebrand factor type A domain-containing protein [Anaerolineales bacterium]